VNRRAHPDRFDGSDHGSRFTHFRSRATCVDRRASAVILSYRSFKPQDRLIDREGIRTEALGAFRDPQLGTVRFQDWVHRLYVVNASALVEINQKFHGWGRDHYYRDFWMFARRDRRWWLVRYDYEPQPPFDRR